MVPVSHDNACDEPSVPEWAANLPDIPNLKILIKVPPTLMLEEPYI